MKIIHTSDLHFGLSLAGRPMIENQRHFKDAFIDMVREEKPACVLVSGDIFDKSVVSAEAVALYDEFVTGVCKLTKLFIIAGNHDGAERLSVCSSLLEESGLYIVGRLSNNIRTHEIRQGNEKIYIHMLPFCNVDEIRVIFGDLEIRSQNEAISTFLSSHELKTDGANILMAHLFAAGGETAGSDVAASVGGSDKVSLDAFKGYDYVALGHIHKAQTMRGNIRYSGAPLKYEFTEKEKSITIYDTQTKEIYARNVNHLYDVREITGTEEEIENISLSDKSKNDFLRIVFTDAYASMHLLEKFREVYPNLLTIMGKRYESGNNTLSANEVSNLSPVDILKRFVLEQTQKEANEKQIELFVREYEKECI